MSTISAGTLLSNALVQTGDTSGNLVFQTNGNTTAMTIDTNQNVTYANGVSFTGVIGGNGANISSINASNLTSGTVATARLASGTANSSTYLRGDQTWAVLSAPNNGTLTMNTSGTGLTGSATFTADQSGNSTFTVTSNANSANGASTIVARDSSGNFTSNNVTLTTGSFSGGSNTAPSITFTGDTNTGIYSPAADTIAFTEGGVESMRIDASGKVGIGITTINSVYASTLGIGGSGSSASLQFRSTNTGTATSDGFDVGLLDSGNTDAYVWQRESGPLIFGTASTERMRITSGGDVGIGTSSPTDALLHLNGGTSTNIKFTNSATGTTSSDGFFVGLSISSDPIAYIFQREAQAMVFGTSNTERMRITSGGNVGIGTTSPSTALHVSGAGTFTGNLNVSTGNATGGGIILADDGDIVDNNDGFCSMRFSSGVRIYSANRGGSPVITLSNGGTVTASNFIGSGVSRAWVYFNGQGGASIMGSYNVGSVTRWANAQYTVNFTSAMPDGNYAAAGMTYDNGNNGRVVCYDNTYTGNSTTGLGISVVDFGYNRFEANRISVVVFR